ncbi:hypothetical protein ACTXT7_013775 [Hymenolepis weldensis]
MPQLRDNCFKVVSRDGNGKAKSTSRIPTIGHGNPLLNSIWLEKSGGPFNFMHSGYGVGAAIAPGMLAPYAYSDVRVLPNGTTLNTTLIHLHTPYYIVAGLCCFVACLFYCFNLCLPKKELQQRRNGCEEE